MYDNRVVRFVKQATSMLSIIHIYIYIRLNGDFENNTDRNSKTYFFPIKRIPSAGNFYIGVPEIILKTIIMHIFVLSKDNHLYNVIL